MEDHQRSNEELRRELKAERVSLSLFPLSLVKTQNCSFMNNIFLVLI